VTYPSILLFDLETTGFDPSVDRILEVGAILVDGASLDEVARWRTLIGRPSIEQMTATVDFHRASGLLGELEEVEDREDYEQLLARAERSVLEWLILEHEVPARQLEIAGYSIHFDRSFVRAQMPRLDSWLSHRMIDVSTLRGLDRRWREQPEAEATKATHRVWPDCEHALASLRLYRDLLWSAGAA
jgi:oligoribonuclease